MRVCKVCKEPKPLTEYYKDKTGAEGRYNFCRQCYRKGKRKKYRADPEKGRESSRKVYAKNKDNILERQRKLRAKNKVKDTAKAKVNAAIRKGTLKRQPCFCGEVKSQGHHPDYSKPLEVIWLCISHHREAHGCEID